MSQFRNKTIQEQILAEEKNMPIRFDIKKDLRYQQGVTKGALKTALRIAKNLLNSGYDIAEVSKHTGVKISTLRKSLKIRG